MKITRSINANGRSERVPVFKQLEVGDKFRFNRGGPVYTKTSARGYKLADVMDAVKRCRMYVQVEVL